MKVHTHGTTGKVEFAGAHDLRRSFGERWAMRVMPQVLMQLMRHETIEKTLKFYIGRNAEAITDVLWESRSESIGRRIGSAPDSAEFSKMDTHRKS